MSLFDRVQSRIGFAGADQIFIGANSLYLADLLDLSPLVVGEITEQRVVRMLREEFVHIVFNSERSEESAKAQRGGIFAAPRLTPRFARSLSSAPRDAPL